MVVAKQLREKQLVPKYLPRLPFYQIEELIQCSQD